VTWETSEPADALVQFSESSGNFPINYTAYDPNNAVFHQLTLERLKPAHTYYFRVSSRDRAGNVSMDDNHGQLYSFTTLQPLFPPWADNLEKGSNDWTVIQAEESELQWTLGVPGNGAAAHSPANAWGSSLDGARASVAESILLTPGIYLTGGDRITLSFAQNYQFVPSSDPDAIEYGEIDLYTNLATAPVTLGLVSDRSVDWEEVQFDLSAYREQLVFVAWHYFLFSIDPAPRFG